jgi:DNA repair protein SbcD/Mre11
VKIAHLADLHLGYRAYHRLAPGGVNQRERDVSEAVARVITGVIEAKPDLVLVAGDVFHSVRPSNAAITDGFRHFMRLRRGLPDAPVVMIAGNHDAPRVTEAGSILRLLAEIPDVYVVDDAARWIELERPAARIFCLPHAAVAAGVPVVDPGTEDGVRILLAHGALRGAGVGERLTRLAEYGGAPLDRSSIRDEAWAYVALGHVHDATRIGANIWYAGAPERTTTDVWGESESRKGWVLFDTDRQEATFQEVSTREVLDLPGFSARAREGAEGEAAAGEAAAGESGGWLDPEAVDRRIRAAVEAVPGGVAGRIVRLVIRDVPRDLFRQLDHRQIRALKAEALHFQLEARRPPMANRPWSGDGDGKRRTLEEELSAFLDGWEPTTPGIQRDRLQSLGSAYLAAGAAAGATGATSAGEPMPGAPDGDGRPGGEG